MEYSAASFDILNTPVTFFEHLASRADQIAHSIKRNSDIKDIECIPLTTCNRIEFYFAGSIMNCESRGASKSQLPAHLRTKNTLRTAIDTVLTTLSENTAFSVEALKGFGRFFENAEVVEHLFRTITGLNSIAIGETQIQGQIKDAYLLAIDTGLAGKKLASLFNAALHAGKHARTETNIEQARISLGNLAIRSLQETGAFAGAIKTVIIGTGKMARNAAEYLLRSGIGSDLVFLTRHPEKRKEQLACFGAEVEHLDALAGKLKNADLVFSAYGTNDLFITRRFLQDILQHRNKPLNLIDIAMPRDIDPGVVDLPGVRLIDFFELEKMKNGHSMLNTGEIAAAEKIIAQEVKAFLNDRKLREVSATISHFRSQAESLRQQELDRALRNLSHLDRREQDIIHKLAYNLVNKILNPPTVKIRQKALAGQLNTSDFQLIDEIFS